MYDKTVPLNTEQQMLVDIACALAANPNINGGDTSIISYAVALKNALIQLAEFNGDPA